MFKCHLTGNPFSNCSFLKIKNWYLSFFDAIASPYSVFDSSLEPKNKRLRSQALNSVLNPMRWGWCEPSFPLPLAAICAPNKLPEEYQYLIWFSVLTVARRIDAKKRNCLENGPKSLLLLFTSNRNQSCCHCQYSEYFYGFMYFRSILQSIFHLTSCNSNPFIALMQLTVNHCYLLYLYHFLSTLIRYSPCWDSFPCCFLRCSWLVWLLLRINPILPVKSSVSSLCLLYYTS
jgi:hypothetical protein